MLIVLLNIKKSEDMPIEGLMRGTFGWLLEHK